MINPLTQLLTFLWFSFFCFGFAVLLADAHILGCNVYDYEEKGSRIARHIGIIPVRCYLFHFKFFRELFRCYFCTGVWCGVLTHVLFRDFYGEVYWLWHESTPLKWFEGILIAAISGAFICYGIDLIFKCLERYSTSLED